MNGILIAQKSIKDKPLFDSRRPRPQIAIGRTPPHLGIFTTIGTAIVTNAGNGFLASETLFTIKHNLGYKPKALVYFYVFSSTSYNVGKYFYASGGADDYITYSVNTTNLSIVHKFDDTLLHSGLTSTAPTVGNIRVKYSIFSNPVNNYTDPSRRL